VTIAVIDRPHRVLRWGTQQVAALAAIAAWRDNPGDKQVFRLFGYAGTGKTTLAKTAAQQETSPVFTAFTAKAATVMRSKGCDGWLPEYGERLVCLKNQHNLGLLNGTIWLCRGTTTGIGHISQRKIIELELESEDEDNLVTFNCPTEDFYEYFDFGYCLTTHKAQGSEWNSVVLVDESYVFRDDASRWLYTGITRAAKRITLIRMKKGGWSS
jgi:hypothetical protein